MLMIDYVSSGIQISGDVPAVLKALEEIGNQLRSYIEQCFRVYLIHAHFGCFYINYTEFLEYKIIAADVS